MATEGRGTMKLAIQALTETVEAGSKSIEIAVMERETGLRFLTDDEVDDLIDEIAREKSAAESARKKQG